MRKALAWWYDRLMPDERLRLIRLAVEREDWDEVRRLATTGPRPVPRWADDGEDLRWERALMTNPEARRLYSKLLALIADPDTGADRQDP